MSQTKAQLLDGSVVSVAFSAGSAATPSLYFAGDLNTGIYSPGADQVAVATNGTGRLFISNGGAVLPSGNLLVGQDTNPSAYTFIANTGSGANNNAAAFTNNADASLDIRLTSGVSLVNAGTGTLALGTSNTERLRITSAGLVGIGTSSPGEKLTVAGNISSSAAQPYISLIDSNWSAGTVIRSGVNTLGTATGDYQLFNVPTGKGFAFAQNNATNSLVIDTAGLVGIGTTSPAQALSVVGNIIADGSAASQYVASSKAGVTTTYLITDANGGNIQTDGAWPIRFTTNSSERARIDTSGRLLVGTSSARSNFFNGVASAALQLEGTGTNRRAAIIGDDFEGSLILASQKSGAVGGNTVLASGDPVGAVSFQGNDGSEFVEAATITAQVDGTPGANDMPGRLVFSTTADGAATPTERLRIDSSGRLLVGTSTDRDGVATGATHTAIFEKSNTEYAQVILATNQNNTNGAYLTLIKSRGTTANSRVIVSSGDEIGAIAFEGSDGTNSLIAAHITALVDGTPGTNDMPGRLVFSTTADGAATPTERVRIDSSGRLLVGTSSSLLSYANLQVTGGSDNAGHVCLANTSAAPVNGANIGSIRFTNSAGGIGAIFGCEADGAWTAGSNYRSRLVFSTTADGAASPTERMRISQNGNAYIGTIADLVSNTNSLHVSGTRAIVGRATGGATNPVITSWNNATSGDNVFISFRTETADTERGTIDYNRAGGQVRYNVTSDRRLKSEIQPAASALDNLAAIQVRAYKWTETDYQINYGFVAQELNEVAPDAVKEGDYGEEITNVWAVDNSKLVPLLTKALQEAIARIETLEAKVAALESA